MLKVICGMQRDLDDLITIRSEHILSERTTEKIMLSAIAECIEFNEKSKETHKTWKFGTEFTYEEKREEFVDILFFIAQLINHLDAVEHAQNSWVLFKEQLKNQKFDEENIGLLFLINKLAGGNIHWILRDYKMLMNTLGYTEEEILEEYKRKWQINIDRITKSVDEGGWSE